MRASEFDIQELARLMVVANELHSDLEDVDPDMTDDAEREALLDAQYYSRKVYHLLLKLARAAQATTEE